MYKRESDHILESLLKLHPKIIDLSLDRMYCILNAMGNPQNKLPPVIHIAGTNGKGSTIAYVRSILEAANLSVHVYTSPHLVYFKERIRLNGALISEEELSRILDYCRDVNNNQPITYFEITTAAAIKAFADHPADILLLEVGLGGRLDATNIVDAPLSTVLTPISLDHEQYLGSDLSEIAMEKASIAKTDVPLVTAIQSEVVHNKISEIAAAKRAPLINNWSYKETETGFLYQDEFGSLELPLPNLVGPHQIPNAALAIAALRHQAKIKIDKKYFSTGITNARWPARMQNISDSPFGRMLPKGSELWLDGGHNPAAGQVINEFFKEEQIILICGMMETKDTHGYLSELSSVTTALYGVHVDGEASHSGEAITQMAISLGIIAKSAKSVKKALTDITSKSPVKVLICGSLYLAGQVLDDNNLIPD